MRKPGPKSWYEDTLFLLELVIVGTVTFASVLMIAYYFFRHVGHHIPG